MRRFATRLSAALFGAACALAGSGAAVLAQSICRQALVLALDVSGSVDTGEYRMQMDGLAAALTDPEVVAAIVTPGAAPVALYIFEWSGPQFQNVILDWQMIGGAGDLQAIAGTLRATTRSPSPPSTALGSAITFGASALAQAPACWRETLDISGDGKSNTGPRPQDLPGLGDLTVNALAIVTPDAQAAGPSDDLVAYFENRVIRGPDAFVEPADGFEDYARAMKKKLLREIKALAIGSLLDGDQ